MRKDKTREDASQVEEWVRWAKRVKTPKREKTWKYVGRFMWSFAAIEATLDTIFEHMFNLDAIAFTLLRTQLDLRKKVELIKLGFDHLIRLASENEDESDQKRVIKNYRTYKSQIDKVHKLYDVRNAIAHSGFEHVDACTQASGVHYKAGVQFDYADRKGSMTMPDPFGRKKRTLDKAIKKTPGLLKDYKAGVLDGEILEDKRTITYAEFDEYHDEMAQLMFYLFEVGADRPINQGLVQFSRNDDFVKDVAKIIASSDNVFPFVRPSPGT